ncbi:cation:proton antiporter [Arcticibacter eurypsychrophilus]|uniref:cation:proton antiporter n=1 Tax=Arcticibacter eurypsychrophilus TaxID=1434752 RepID=UPI00084D97C5|nr:cation:proton antiporter [Arcticibacter eurypsychrophilus]
MIHLPQLVTDLGLILAAAAFTTLLFKKIKQPLVLGYIIAGLLVGPHFNFFPSVSDEASISTWAEIGVIFLLFSLGLEFSFKKLAKVGGAASVTGITEVSIMLLLGYTAGVMLGWSTMDSIFLGGMLAISSTTIIIRAIDELGIKHKKYVNLVFGVLIIEDLVAILLLVVLSTMAVSREFEGTEMLFSILKFGFFLILWFIGGIFLIPTFLKKTHKLMNDETMLIVSIALCLLMVMLAVQVGFSPALGAFIMGSILAETTMAERIEHITKSVKDLFAAVFFVSVGMLIDPSVLMDYAIPILIISLVSIFGKPISTLIGALLSGQTLRTSLQSGMCLAQIGEFSFIIATLGVTLNVTSSFLYPVAVAVSALTTFTTPYLIKASGPFAEYLEQKLPAKWISTLSKYSSSTEGISETSDWKILLKAYFMHFLIHSVILIALLYVVQHYLHPFIITNITNGIQGTGLTMIISFILMAPFLWAFALRRIEKRAYAHLWLNKKYSRGPLVALEALRISLAIIYLVFLFTIVLDTKFAIIIAILAIVLVVFIFSKKLQFFYGRLENRFLLNLNDRENSVDKTRSNLVPWDAHLTELIVSPESTLVGKSLIELAIRERHGVNIALIERGNLVIATPAGNERIYPNDQLTVIGTDDQIAALKAQLEVSDQYNETIQSSKKDLELQKIVITSKSPVCNQTIRNSGVREKTQGLIVGIERLNERILNPDSTLTLLAGDIVWIVGNRKKIVELLKD